MKVAILTQPLGHNYGGLLQAYALQIHLKKQGFEVETLDRRRTPSWKGLAKQHSMNFIRLVQGRIKSMPTAKKNAYSLQDLAEFRNSRLTMSPMIASEHELRDYCRAQNFDVFLVGSDQVWRPMYSPSILNFYLDFLDDIKSSAKRVAYAASFGVDEWEYSARVTEKCKKLAQQFSAISVRELSAVDLCLEKFDVSAQYAVDPTLLLDPADYEQLIKGSMVNGNAGCMLYYVLDSSPDKKSIAEKVGSQLNAEVYSVKPECSVADVGPNDLEKARFPSVESWLQSFRDAKFIVTDSFHGTVFSILFNRPFIAIGNSARGMARFESLLSQFGLTDRLISTVDELTPDLVQKPIDWVSIDSKRRAMADESSRFLIGNISDGKSMSTSVPRASM